MDSSTPIYKYTNRHWRKLPATGDNMSINDPKLKQGYIGDLNKKTAIELEEILKRQDQTLNNKVVISKLKDKGQSLQKRRQEIANALEAAREREKNLEEAERLNDINLLEWNRGMTNTKTEPRKKKDILDSDDDVEEMDDKLDPLKLMAYHSSCIKKPIQNVKRTEEEDPADAIARELRQLEIQDHAEVLSKALTNISIQEQKPAVDFGSKRDHMLAVKHKKNGPVKDSFKPFRRCKNPLPVPGIEHHASGRQSSSSICIPQKEALKLEHDYIAKENERLLQDTREQLKTFKTENIGLPPSVSLGKYRDTNLSKHILDFEDDEEDELYYTADLETYYENLSK
ncbi:transmembrane and coiled-coil domain-containing protein 5B [Procambarus clarkii]|uniref:transmembrane and coiled-coil domain-containing protein 5B n=1 Tax=Procambarus clarkii TaxID=6728 RepID=UPI001E67455E|nr:uncharacterized protein LOC123746122 [Procambarus clarkii]